MSKGKIIVIEGTDCSGKETQSKLLEERLQKENYKIKRFSFPMYDTPTGKIVGGPYLGKEEICPSYFEEGSAYVDPYVSSLYYAADRKYNFSKIEEYLNKGYHIILDRYVTSNMAHQGGKIKDSQKRKEMYDWLQKLEFDLLKLPVPDATIFLHLPYEYYLKLAQKRTSLDGHESSEEHLRNAEESYLELAKLFNWYKVECTENNQIKSVQNIHDEVYNIIRKKVLIKKEN